MDTVKDIIKEHDSNMLYAMFGVQCLIVFIGFPFLIMQCAKEETRIRLSYGRWMAKWLLISYVGKWMLETYDLVEVTMNDDGVPKNFNPYKLLKMENDGSFDTEAINSSFHRLRVKYHPKNVNPEKVPYLKAVRRYDNLVKAFETLTQPKLFDNWKEYGDPLGSKTIKTLELAIPTWLTGDDFQPMLITWGFIGLIGLGLGLSVW